LLSKKKRRYAVSPAFGTENQIVLCITTINCLISADWKNGGCGYGDHPAKDGCCYEVCIVEPTGLVRLGFYDIHYSIGST